MIFVTLGTQDKPFNRLLEAIQKQIDLGNIKDEVIVQAGCTKFESNDMKIFDLIPMDKFSSYIKDADILITHGGAGSMVDAIKLKKKIIAAPRLAKYGEHVNDHQLQLIGEFDRLGYLVSLNDFDKLDDALKRIKKFKPKEFVSNNEKFVKIVDKIIKE